MAELSEQILQNPMPVGGGLGSRKELLAERYHDLREEKLVAHEKFDAGAADVP